MEKKEKRKININKKADFILGGILLVVLLTIGVFYYISTKNSETKETLPKKNEEKIEEKLKILDPNSKTRPYAVMINNLGTARPLQSGLQDAYIIYEIIVEGGLTRYMALFMDANVERIGSVRSARHYYLDYALENDAFYVHHGQSPQAQSDFSALGVDRIVVDASKTGWRDKTLNVASEHTLFTSTEKLANGLSSKRTERNKDLLLNYSVEEIDLSKISGATPANKVSIDYSGSMNSSYEYDSVNKVYNRFINRKEHTDYVTKKQYTFKNIITYQVTNTSIAGDSSGRQDLKNVGEGKGYYISNGYALPITWSKSSRSAQTVYKLENGDSLKVNDGNTFIQIQPTNKNITLS